MIKTSEVADIKMNASSHIECIVMIVLMKKQSYRI